MGGAVRGAMGGAVVLWVPFCGRHFHGRSHCAVGAIIVGTILMYTIVMGGGSVLYDESLCHGHRFVSAIVVGVAIMAGAGMLWEEPWEEEPLCHGCHFHGCPIQFKFF